MNKLNICHTHLPETSSTNNAARDLPFGEGFCTEGILNVISTDYQTAGRGQRGNTWESAPNKNLLFSLSLYPDELPSSRQFVICELISVTLCEVLSRYTEGIHIKWPNDIYHHNHKLCGILIEHDIEGSHITRSIIGVGINVNQTHFTSNAPNPISLYQILGHETDREELLSAICEAIATSPLLTSPSKEEYTILHHRYISMLYRRDVPADYRDANGKFTATLRDVSPDGLLTLEDLQGKLRSYLFKEITFIVNTQ